MAGTMVIVEQRSWLGGLASFKDQRAVTLAGMLPAGMQVTRSQAHCLASYVERRGHFSAARRREIARHVAEPLIVRFGLHG